MAIKGMFSQLCTTRKLLSAWKIIRQKGAAGGVDGQTVEAFEKNLENNLSLLLEELKTGEWKPEPYFRISIPKKDNETRKLGLLCVRDKIVQQAIRQLIEPRFERLFVSNSYGYRPGKGHTKAIRFTKACFQNKKYQYVIRLDIDNYFDNIDQELLFRRAASVIPDEDVLRLVRLCIKMGLVSKSLKWEEISKGVPQGAIISPVLANFYLHPFDQFVLTRTKAYVRYADDFLIGCDTAERAEELLSECSDFLANRLKLNLNPPSVSELKDGIEFLGITLNDKELSLSPSKQSELIERIRTIDWDGRSFGEQGLKKLAGMHSYYGRLLLYRRMNTSLSVIHAPQQGKPTLVYDVIEIFRAQAVDRVVISMIQKHEPLAVADGRIDEKSKVLLIQNISERMNRYEKYKGKETRLCDIMDLQVKEIAEYIVDGAKYKPYIAKW